LPCLNTHVRGVLLLLDLAYVRRHVRHDAPPLTWPTCVRLALRASNLPYVPMHLRLSHTQPAAEEMIGGRARVLVGHLRGRQKSSSFWGVDAKGDVLGDASGDAGGDVHGDAKGDSGDVEGDSGDDQACHQARDSCVAHREACLAQQSASASRPCAGASLQGGQAGSSTGAGEESTHTGTRGCGAPPMRRMAELHKGLGTSGCGAVEASVGASAASVQASARASPSSRAALPSALAQREVEMQDKEMQWLTSITEVSWPARAGTTLSHARPRACPTLFARMLDTLQTRHGARAAHAQDVRRNGTLRRHVVRRNGTLRRHVRGVPPPPPRVLPVPETTEGGGGRRHNNQTDAAGQPEWSPAPGRRTAKACAASQEARASLGPLPQREGIRPGPVAG